MLSKLQEKIINSPEDRVLVISSAASGKTTVLTEKTRALLKSGVKPNDIAVITFTNMAAAELKERLKDDYKKEMFVGTIHSLANKFLKESGYNTSSIIKEEKFDMLFEKIQSNPECVQNIPYVLLDEAQDIDNMQYDFIFNLIDPEHFFVCGDLRQSIYGFRGANPKLLKNMSKRWDVATYSLNENYRNGKNILDFAKNIIKKSGIEDDSVAMSEDGGKVLEMSKSYSRICRGITQKGEYGKWAILTRTNLEASNIEKELTKENIPWESFKQGDLTKEELNSKLKNETVKVLTIHSSKGLEWDNVIVIDSPMRKKGSQEENLQYVAATRARKFLVWVKNNFRSAYDSF